MLRWFIGKRLDAAEKRLGVPVDYLRHMAKVALPAFLKFTKFMPISAYRKKLPAEAFYLAQLVAVQQEDCGACVQIVVNLARQDGVPAELLRTTLAGTIESLPGALPQVCQFALAVVQQRDAEELRQSMREQYGEEGLVELSMAIASSRVYPTLKRGLGFAKSCSVVKVVV